MRRILGATALVALISIPAIAPAQDVTFLEVDLGAGEAYLASRMIGQRVYATEAQIDRAAGVARGAEAEWDDIGQINDLVMTASGQVEAVIIGVGGFLGLGERDVAVALSSLTIVPETDDPNQAYLVLNTTREMLEAAPDFERQAPLGEGVAGPVRRTRAPPAPPFWAPRKRRRARLRRP